MLALVVSPTIGREVSRGVLGTKDLDAPKGLGWSQLGMALYQWQLDLEVRLVIDFNSIECVTAYQQRFLG